MCFQYTDTILREAALWTRLKSLRLIGVKVSTSSLQPLWTVQGMEFNFCLLEGQLTPPGQSLTDTFGSSLTQMSLINLDTKPFPLNFLTFCQKLRSIDICHDQTDEPVSALFARSSHPLDNLEKIFVANIDHLVQLSRGASARDPPSPFVSLKEMQLAIGGSSQRTREATDVFQRIRSLHRLTMQSEPTFLCLSKILTPLFAVHDDVPHDVPLRSVIQHSSSTLRSINLTLQFDRVFNERHVGSLNECLEAIKGQNCLEELLILVNLDHHQTLPPAVPPSFTHLASLADCLSSNPKTDFPSLAMVDITYDFYGYDEEEGEELGPDHWMHDNFIDPYVAPLQDTSIPFRTKIQCFFV